MGTAAGTAHILLSDRGAFVDVAPEHGSDAWMHVSAGPDDVRVAPCALLVERAVEEAHGRSVRRIDTALDIAAPSTGVLLQVLRRHLGREVASVSMHRAGASAMVTILLSPPAVPDGAAPPPADPAQRGDLPARPGIPTQGRRRPRVTTDGRPRTRRGHRSSR